MSFDRRNPSFEGHRVIKVTIEKLVATQDTYGDPSKNWQTFASGVPMALENTSGDERFGDQQIEGIDHWEGLMRFMRGVNTKMRVNFTLDGVQNLLDITSIDPNNFSRRWLILKCKSGVNRG